MLCRICSQIFEDGGQAREYRLKSIGVEHARTDRFTHHATTRSLIDSAALYCYICSRVWRDALSRGFSRGPEVRWQKDCSTAYVIQAFDRETLSTSALELLVSYARKRRVIDDGPGLDKIIFWTKFVLEPVISGSIEDGGENAGNSRSTLENTESDPSWSQASKWISDCLCHHKDCIQPGSLGKQLPKRLINVGESGSSMVQLYEGNDLLYESNDLLNPAGERYMTLSHCWGRAQILQLNNLTYERLKTGVNDSELPPTFRDAIQFTRRCGVKYIWIDSLCIFQDSIEDWLRESSAMTRIYQQALCNISALASLTTNGGCFRERDSRSIKPCRISARWAGLPKGTFNIHHEMLWQNDVAAMPLHKRAWVVQERLLAPRVLHFGREQLFWECHTMNACETYPDGLPQSLALSDPSINFKGLNPSIGGESLRKLSNWDCSDPSLNQLYIWEKVVRAYTSCALTKEHDKLIAISGIAKRVQPLSLIESTNKDKKLASYRPAKYLAGLWDFFLPAQLLWEVRQGSQPSTYRAPSWSWASLDGEVSFCTAFNDGEDHITILDATTNPVSEDVFGQVIGGKIYLEGSPKLLSSTTISSTGHAVLKISNHTISIGHTVSKINNYTISTLCRPDITDIRTVKSLYCLPIRTYRITTPPITTHRLGCLILEPTRRNPGEFRRWAQINFENGHDQAAIHKANLIDELDFLGKNPATGRYTMTIV